MQDNTNAKPETRPLSPEIQQNKEVLEIISSVNQLIDTELKSHTLIMRRPSMLKQIERCQGILTEMYIEFAKQ